MFSNWRAKSGGVLVPHVVPMASGSEIGCDAVPSGLPWYSDSNNKGLSVTPLLRGVHAVKVDLKKLLKPKKFGWRFIGCDLKMPNGLLVECYIAFTELMAVDRAAHIFFEKWRGKDLKNLSADEQRQFEEDAKESTKRYNQAFCETLKRTTQNHWRALFDAFPSAKRDEVVEVYNQILTGSDVAFSQSEFKSN